MNVARVNPMLVVESYLSSLLVLPLVTSDLPPPPHVGVAKPPDKKHLVEAGIIIIPNHQ